MDVLAKSGRQFIALPESKILGKISSEIFALREKMVFSIVLGNITIGDGLAKYQAKVQNLGINKVLEELNKKG